jgi:peptidase, M23 family
LGVAARINQLGLKLKGSNGEKISIINTMDTGQDWVKTAAILVGETVSISRDEIIISFVGGSNGTFFLMIMSLLSRRSIQMIYFWYRKLMSMADGFLMQIVP